jgi:4'-phosphopantetheinyl transferase
MIIYIFDDMENIDVKEVLSLIERMPPQRAIQAQKYIHLKDRLICVLSFLLLEYGLKEAGISREEGLHFTYGRYEKPYLKEGNIFFNISHTEDKIICCIADNECGADIEKIKPLKEDLIRRVCSDEEINMLLESKNKEELFTKLWTMKESYIKYKGASIGMDLKKIRILIQKESVFVQSSKYGQYIISVSSSSKKALAYKNISLKELLNQNDN